MKTMRLEGFVNRNDVKVSHKFGIMGLGQYGGKIADLFAGLEDAKGRKFYDSIAVNSFSGDLKPLKELTDERKYSLVGVEGGCGRKPELAQEALQTKVNQTKLINMVQNLLNDNDIYLVSAGLGGGTGTGLITTAIKLLHAVINRPLIEKGEKPKTIGAIVTLPRKSEPLAEKKNALKAIKELEELMHSKITNFKFIIFVDNEKAFRDFRKLKADGNTEFENWMEYSNYQVVSALHEINVATSFSSDKAFDPQDFANIFNEMEGAMTFGKIKFPSSDIKDSDDLVNRVIDTFHEGNVLANGFDLKKSRTAGVLIVKPDKDKIVTANSLDDIEEKLSEEMPAALYRPTGYIDWANPKETIIYTITKVAEMPKRARTELDAEYTEALKAVKDDIRKDKAETNFEKVDDSIFNTETAASIEDDFDIFGTSNIKKKEPEPVDDFSDVF